MIDKQNSKSSPPEHRNAPTAHPSSLNREAPFGIGDIRRVFECALPKDEALIPGDSPRASQQE